jgi:putative tricarboxylic transport membrane protein
LVCTRYMRKMVSLPRNYIYAAVVIFALIGSYIVRNDTFDLYYTLAFSIIGLLCRKGGIPMIPLLISFILGPSLELKIRQTLDLNAGDLTVFLTEPISAAFLAVSVLAIVYTFYRKIRKQRTGSVQP